MVSFTQLQSSGHVTVRTTFFHWTLHSKHFHHVTRVFRTTIFNEHIVFPLKKAVIFSYLLFNHSLIERHLSYAQSLALIMLNITFSFIYLHGLDSHRWNHSEAERGNIFKSPDTC